VRVAAPPEAGRANEELLGLLSRVLEIPRAQLRLVSGQGGRDKIIEVNGIDSEESERRLASAGRGRGK